jgi:hypothetical protein
MITNLGKTKSETVNPIITIIKKIYKKMLNKPWNRMVKEISINNTMINKKIANMKNINWIKCEIRLRTFMI